MYINQLRNRVDISCGFFSLSFGKETILCACISRASISDKNFYSLRFYKTTFGDKKWKREHTRTFWYMVTTLYSLLSRKSEKKTKSSKNMKIFCSFCICGFFMFFKSLSLCSLCSHIFSFCGRNDLIVIPEKLFPLFVISEF